MQSFVARIRAKRGLPALEPVADPLREGDYLKYVPYEVGVEARVGRSVARQLMSIALWGAVARWLWDAMPRCSRPGTCSVTIVLGISRRRVAAGPKIARRRDSP